MTFRLSVLAAALLAAGAAQAQPKVVASIPPLQALAAGVMAGVGAPQVILRGAASPHAYALRPSDARLLADADLVLWIGPGYETFLAKSLAEPATRGRALALVAAPGVRTLPARAGGAWADDGHGHGPAHDHAVDPHIFLSPANGQAIARAVAEALGRIDPARAALYQANAAALAARIDTVDAELKSSLRDVRDVPFVVFHDGYQYFEAHYGLRAAGTITVAPERPPGARRLSAIRRKITELRAACVFAEPQFSAAVVRTVAEGTGARIATLDYMGGDYMGGGAGAADSYFALLRGLARSFAGCLRG